MSQALDPSWWISLADQIWIWWAACALLGLAALPLTVRIFVGLADRGAGLAIGVGVILMTWTAWLFGHLGLPHRRATIAFCAFLVVAASIAAWWRRPRGASAAIRSTLVPFLAAQLLFAIGFAYFCNVRSYLPWATFDIGLSGAEKAGNLMHLNSVMRSDHMPPRDAWLLGEPTNYYYGGHLLVATLAKLTGTPARVAFNLGLATIFALSLSMGFSLCYSMAVRRGPRGRRGRIVWHRGLAWGLLGGLAIALFGNLDAWRQLGKRDPDNARHQLAWRLRGEAERTFDRARFVAIEAELKRLASLTPEQVRWSVENLKQIDYWASSRAIRGGPPGADPGTITEFPYFSAMLGDLHPHHMALPYSIAGMAAALALLRRNPRNRALTESAWRTRCGPAALAMGVAIGAVFAVNIWDSIVLSVLYLLVIAFSRRRVEADDRWRWLAFAAFAVALSWGAALLVNLFAAVPALGTPAAYALALLVAFAGPWIVRRRFRALAEEQVHRATLAAVAAVAATGAVLAGLASGVGFVATLLAALRDALLVAGTMWTARQMAFAWSGRPLRQVTGALGTYACVGGLAIVVAAPFMLNFHSPLEAQATLLERKIPPVLSASVRSGEGPLAARLWAASPINPFAAELRSELGDFLAHWGLFVLPLAAFVAVHLIRLAWRQPLVAARILLAAAIVGFATYIVLARYWAGALAIAFAVACVALAGLRRVRIDAAPLLFAATGFFWCWFVEALHFDDSYGGALERYNTPFKIFYPVWPLLAAAAVGALRRLSPRLRGSAWPLVVVAGSPGVWTMALVVAAVGAYTLEWRLGLRAAGVAIVAALVVGTLWQLVARVRRLHTTDAAALAAASLMVLLGVLYPFAATAQRTRSFFAESIEGTWMADPNGERVREFYTRRTLDGLAWLGQTKAYAHDLSAIEWLNAKASPGAVVLEAPSHGAYTPEGRVSSMTGVPTLVGWQHHQNQWRGWAKPMPRHLQQRLFEEFTDVLPPTDIGVPLARDAELALYRASLDSAGALRAKLREHLPDADRRSLREAAERIVTARQKTLSATALTGKLVQRMEELYRKPIVDDEARRWIDLYGIRYVFVGALERRTFGATVDKFATLPRLFADGETAIYEAGGGSAVTGSTNIPGR